MNCGLWYSVCLVSIGLCCIKILSCWLLGRVSLEDIEIQISGVVLLCMFWCLWREWNAKCFEDFEWSILDIKSFFFFFFLEWSLVLPSCPSLSLLFQLINIIWVFNFCHYSTFPVYLGWLFFNKKFLHYLKKKKKKKKKKRT